VTKSPTREPAPPARTSARLAAHRWLLLVHQLPSTPSNLRVRTWRRLQQLGALAVKQSVYVLPDSPGAREDFEWLKAEIESAGGQATVFAAGSVDAWSDDELVEAFRQARQQEYTQVAGKVEAALGRTRSIGRRSDSSTRNRWRRLAEVLRQRQSAIEATDFFGSAGRDRALALLAELDDRLSVAPRSAATDTPRPRAAYRARRWVTRPRPGVDRMASAWLIRRFIDPEASFGFADNREAVSKDALAFDMFGVEFSHQADRCTFETLCRTFAIDDPAVARMAGLVHDLDLKDGKFGAPEAATIGTLIEGLRALHADDHELLAQGMTLFEAFYLASRETARRSGPRPVVKKAQRRNRRRRRQA